MRKRTMREGTNKENERRRLSAQSSGGYQREKGVESEAKCAKKEEMTKGRNEGCEAERQ